MDGKIIVKQDISESYLVTMVRDILAKSTSDANKIQDLQFIMGKYPRIY